jgi:hypothetical protein
MKDYNEAQTILQKLYKGVKNVGDFGN